MKQQDAGDFKGVLHFADTMSYMKNLHDREKNCLEILFGVIITIYLYCMVMYPTLNNWNMAGTWQEVQKVWDRWQSFNAAVIALLASVIAFKATTYHYHRERENNFRAAKAKLPQALSDLSIYTRECASVHRLLHALATRNANREEFLQSVRVPARPNEAIDIFVECIKYSDRHIGNYLAKILEELQVMHARIESKKKDTFIVRPALVGEVSCIDYIARSRLKINHLFDFARNEAPFTETDFSIEALRKVIVFSFDIMDIEIYPAQPQ